MVALVKETKGEVFIKAIEEAKNNKGHIFSLLLETLQNEYPQAEAVTIVNKVKNFDALVNYDASLAKFQIGRNGDNIRKTMEDDTEPGTAFAGGAFVWSALLYCIPILYFTFPSEDTWKRSI